MTNVYKLAKTWQYMLIIPSLGLICVFLLPLLSFLCGNIPGKLSEFIWVILIVSAFSGSLTYAAVTSKIITSPEGVENISFGIRVKVKWDKVERIDINPYGFVNLVFKEPIYKNNFINRFLHPFDSDRMIQLSPYMDDLATSNLLKDIEKYVANNNIPEFVVEQKRNRKTYQKVGVIGLYYLCWFLVLAFLAVIFRKGAEYLETSGLSNMTLISYLVTISLMAGLFINGLNLLGYNAEISELNDIEISHKARTHYLSPFVIILIGFLVSFGIWALLQSRSITVGESSFGIVAMLLGAISLRVSGVIERLLFKDTVK